MIKRFFSQIQNKYSNYINYEYDYNNHLDDFELIEKIGQGKYSSVYLALNIVKNRYCALKFLNPIKQEKINRELLVYNRLENKSENLVKIWDNYYEYSTGINILELEYISKNNLAFLLKNNNNFSIKEIIDIMKQVINAIDYMHNKWIFHRDIKPSNIILNENNKVKIIDFGLSEFLIENKEYNVSIASRPFKAPEVLFGIKNYDQTFDIWGIGLILGCLLTKNYFVFRNGKDNIDQLKIITNYFGVKKINDSFIKNDYYNINDSYLNIINDCDYNGYDPDMNILKNKIKEIYKDHEVDELLYLLENMLNLDPNKRIKLKDILNNKLFNI